VEEEGVIDINEMVSMDDPRYLYVKGDDDGEEAKEGNSISPYFQLCCSMGRCHWEGGIDKESHYNWLEDRYLMMVEVYEQRQRRVVLSSIGPVVLNSVGYDGDSNTNRWVIKGDTASPSYGEISWAIRGRSEHILLMAEVVLVDRWTKRKALLLSHVCYAWDDSNA